MFRCRPVSLALVGLFVWLAGCMTWSQIQPGEVADHGKVRVQAYAPAADSSFGRWQWVIQDARLAGDSLTGRVHSYSSSARYYPEYVTFPLDRVFMVEAERVDPLKTFGGIVLLVGGVAYLVWFWGGVMNWSN